MGKPVYRTITGPRGTHERVRVDMDAPENAATKAKYLGTSETKSSAEKPKQKPNKEDK